MYGLTGWVRNLPNGQVELMAYGNRQQLDQLKAWLKSGPDLARVSNLQSKEIEFQEIEGFSIL